MTKDVSRCIPKMIFNVWHAPCRTCLKALPNKLRRMRQSCMDMYPDYEFRLLDFEKSREFIRTHFDKKYLTMFDSYKISRGTNINIKQIDAIRYFYLYYHGGIYMDLDMLCLRRYDLDEWDKPTFGYLYRDYERHDGAIGNDWMAAPARDPLLMRMIENLLIKSTPKTNVMEATGPNFLTRTIREYGLQHVKVFEMPKIFTYEWDGNERCISVAECKEMFPTAYTSELYLQSWVPKWFVVFDRNSLNGKFWCAGDCFLRVFWNLKGHIIGNYVIGSQSLVQFIDRFKDNKPLQFSIIHSSKDCLVKAFEHSFPEETLEALFNLTTHLLEQHPAVEWPIPLLEHIYQKLADTTSIEVVQEGIGPSSQLYESQSRLRLAPMSVSRLLKMKAIVEQLVASPASTERVNAALAGIQAAFMEQEYPLST